MREKGKGKRPPREPALNLNLFRLRINYLAMRGRRTDSPRTREWPGSGRESSVRVRYDVASCLTRTRRVVSRTCPYPKPYLPSREVTLPYLINLIYLHRSTGMSEAGVTPLAPACTSNAPPRHIRLHLHLHLRDCTSGYTPCSVVRTLTGCCHRTNTDGCIMPCNARGRRDAALLCITATLPDL